MLFDLIRSTGLGEDGSMLLFLPRTPLEHRELAQVLADLHCTDADASMDLLALSWERETWPCARIADSVHVCDMAEVPAENVFYKV